MGKVAEKPPRQGAPLDPRDVPNRTTREAMRAAVRGDGVDCKDADDLLKKLKS